MQEIYTNRRFHSGFFVPVVYFLTLSCYIQTPSTNHGVKQMTFYHGTTTATNINYQLLPPNHTNVISEKGRKKNLGRVFFTKDLGLAKIYAGRAARSIGGDPVVYRVVSPVDVVCMNDTKGATVYHAEGAFCELID